MSIAKIRDGIEFQFTHPGKGATSLGVWGAFSRKSFNSRTLGRVRQMQCTHREDMVMFQFTHPGKGATESGWMHRLVLPCFNSRTLGRVRLSEQVALHSIFRFNSRTLGRVRRENPAFSTSEFMFQFTHPGKGATAECSHIWIAQKVSIHAPWEGCDSRWLVLRSFPFLFQFTHPGKGATCRLLHMLTSP